MTAMEQFERWTRRARGDVAPQPDVSHAVMRRLQGEPEPAPAGPGSPLWILSGVSACAATVCGYLGYYGWMLMESPMRVWVQDFAQMGSL